MKRRSVKGEGVPPSVAQTPEPRQAGPREKTPLGIRALVAASLCTTLGVLPPFLLGAMSFSIREEMGFSQARLGAAIGVFFAASALASIPGGRLAERIGGKQGMSVAVAASLVALLGMATLAGSWWHVVGFHVLGGCAAGLSTPATSLSLARLIAPGRQGLAFGLSKGAGPTASMLAGLAVPVVALTIGWRWAYVIVALGGALFWLIVPDDPATGPNTSMAPSASRPASAPGPPLMLLACGVGFGMGATHAMASFFVESAVGRGFDPGFAGFVLAFGSLAGVIGRVLWGWVVDRWQRSQLMLVAGLMAAGGAATLGFGLVSSALGLVAVAVVAFGAGWGWSGVFVLAIVRLSPEAPGKATGITASGMFVGSTVGPLAFGAMTHAVSYSAIWAAGSGSLIVGAALVLIAAKVIRQRKREVVDSRGQLGPEPPTTAGLPEGPPPGSVHHGQR